VVEGNEIPYQPWALAKRQENFKNRRAAILKRSVSFSACRGRCTRRFPFQIIHSPGYIAVFSEYAHTTRSIFMNSEHPPGPIEWFMGDSRGRWEGDTLVVDVKYFTDQTWLDRAGNFHSEDLHVVERYTMTTPDHIQYEATLEDPKCSPGHGRSAWCSTAARNRTYACSSTSVTRTQRKRRPDGVNLDRSNAQCSMRNAHAQSMNNGHCAMSNRDVYFAPSEAGLSEAPRKKLRPSAKVSVLPLARGAPLFER
jgi:hypothetical protein